MSAFVSLAMSGLPGVRVGVLDMDEWMDACSYEEASRFFLFPSTSSSSCVSFSLFLPIQSQFQFRNRHERKAMMNQRATVYIDTIHSTHA